MNSARFRFCDTLGNGLRRNVSEASRFARPKTAANRDDSLTSQRLSPLGPEWFYEQLQAIAGLGWLP
jgi:hypothetical protein